VKDPPKWVSELLSYGVAYRILILNKICVKDPLKWVSEFRTNSTTSFGIQTKSLIRLMVYSSFGSSLIEVPLPQKTAARSLYVRNSFQDFDSTSERSLFL